MPFTNVGRSGGVVNVRPPAPRAAAPPPPRVQANPDNQVIAAPPPRVQANPDQQPAGRPALAHAIARSNTGRPDGPMSGSPNVKPLAKNTSASPAAQRIANMIMMRLWTGRDQAFMAPTVPIGTTAGYEGGLTGFRQSEMRAQFQKDFASLRSQGMLPPGTKIPPMYFPQQGAGRNGELSYESGGKVFMSPQGVKAATDPYSPDHAWGQITPIHELAHAMQLPRVMPDKALREGGAQAYADAAAPRVIGPVPENDTSYSDYTQAVRGLGSAWYMSGQFRRGKKFK